jgi:hypothetical protein
MSEFVGISRSTTMGRPWAAPEGNVFCRAYSLREEKRYLLKSLARKPGII